LIAAALLGGLGLALFGSRAASQAAAPSPVPHVNAQHLTSGQACRRCHAPSVVQGLVQRASERTDCTACHDDSAATAPAASSGVVAVVVSSTPKAAARPSHAADAHRGMVRIPAGPFQMGSNDRHPDESPLHVVDIPTPYDIDLYEVTNAEYRDYLRATGRSSKGIWPGGDFPPDLARHPVANVNWFEAKAYCEWRGKRLPTEAEWEKAARGTDGRMYPWGNTMDVSRANIAESRIGHTMPVGSYPKGRSPYGLYDVAGNVWDWTEDWYKPYPGNHEPDDNYGERYKVARGGGFNKCTFYGCGSHAPTFNRAFFNPASRMETFGFRCAQSAGP
jgi:formylglycine-generating enzyme required for sulfatase activity